MRALVVVFIVLLSTAAGAETRVERGYRSGRPIAIELMTIGWADVEVKTARAFLRMAQAARDAGIELVIRSGFRSHERQKALYRAWRAGWGNRAARPGYSNHESGRALDIDLDQAGTLDWLRANAGRYGFKNTVRGEPWHWELRARR